MAGATAIPGWGRAQAAVGVALFLCLFAAQAGLIVLTPVLSEVADDLDVSTAAAGQLRTVSGLTAGLTAILLGTVGRSLSLRRVLIGGAGGLALASVVSAAAPSFAVLALGQALLGVSVAALPSEGPSLPPSGCRVSIAHAFSLGPGRALLQPGSWACR